MIPALNGLGLVGSPTIVQMSLPAIAQIHRLARFIVSPDNVEPMVGIEHRRWDGGYCFTNVFNYTVGMGS
jgi:hypothetical protein